MKSSPRDRATEFLSEEDLDLANLTLEELVVAWNNWLVQAQATNDEDRGTYEHGVFLSAPTSACTTSSREAPRLLLSSTRSCGTGVEQG